MEGPRGEFWSMPEVGTRMRGAGPSDVTGRTRAALVPLATARLVTRSNVLPKHDHEFPMLIVLKHVNIQPVCD